MVSNTSIPSYGNRYRNGEAISSVVAESVGNQIVSKRFVKKQQMRWTRRVAHLLLQVWTVVLNGGFCISPRNGVLVSGGYAKTPMMYIQPKSSCL